MNLITLAWDVVSKHIKSFLILVLQMVLSSIILLSMVCKVESISNERKIVDVFQEDEAYYFTLPSYYSEMPFDYKSIIDQVGVKYKESSITELVFLGDENTKEIDGYSDDLIMHANVSMKTGEWFRTDVDCDRVPIVAIGDQYAVNDEIEFKNANSGEKYIARVIGTIDYEEYVMRFTSSANSGKSALNMIVGKARDCCDFIAPYESSIWNCFKYGDSEVVKQQRGEMIIFEEHVSDEKVMSVLEEYGCVSYIKDMKYNYNQSNNEFLLTNGIVLCIFTLLTLAGIGGVNSMINLQNQRRYTIFYMYGMNNRQVAIIEALRSGGVIVISCLLLMVLFKWTAIGGIVTEDKRLLNFLNFFFVIGYMIAIYVITSFPFVYKLCKENLIEMYKKKA